VLRSSPCSVEIVRPHPAPRSPSDGMKILLATDGSESSSKALCAIANRPWPAKTQIRILSVVELPIVQANPLPEYSEYPNIVFESACKEVRMRAKEAVTNAREMLSAAGLSVCDREATPEGDPRSVILDLAEAWEEDLIVLGSHGKQAWDRLLIGSVAESVALHAHCSVEIIRR
jgi:nucleotide-binding universal stress UspA family protein